MASEEKMKIVKLAVAGVALLAAIGLLMYHFGVFDSSGSSAAVQPSFTPEEQQQIDKQIEAKKQLEKKKPPAGS